MPKCWWCMYLEDIIDKYSCCVRLLWKNSWLTKQLTLGIFKTTSSWEPLVKKTHLTIKLWAIAILSPFLECDHRSWSIHFHRETGIGARDWEAFHMKSSISNSFWGFKVRKRAVGNRNGTSAFSKRRRGSQVNPSGVSLHPTLSSRKMLLCRKLSMVDLSNFVLHNCVLAFLFNKASLSNKDTIFKVLVFLGTGLRRRESYRISLGFKLEEK